MNEAAAGTNRERVAVYKVIGAVLLAWIVGAAAGSIALGVGVMLALFVPIWRTYSGNPITNKWYKRGVLGFWIVLGGLFLAVIGMTWWADSNAPPTVEVAKSPAQIREQQIQAALSRGEPRLVAHIKSGMHDPDSFELVDGRYVDGGDHVTLVMTYRGRNGFNALRLEKVGAAFDLQGNLISVQKVE